MQIAISCELTITPGHETLQTKLRLSVGGETVFDQYEQALNPYQLAACKEIAAAHARLLKKWAESKS